MTVASDANIVPPRRLRRTVYQLLEVAVPGDAGSRVADDLLTALIVANVFAVVLESVPAFSELCGPAFDAFELFSVAVFTVEYALRLWASVESPGADELQPMRVRLKHAATPLALTDLAAIAPFYLMLFMPVDLRLLRVLRILRVLKLVRYSPALGLLLDVVRAEARGLGAALFILLLVMTFASSGIYLAEVQAQPDAFGSIPAAMWWAVATLTTVGYGDVTPITPIGKLFGAAVQIGGIAIVALPTGLLASGFTEELRRRRERFERAASEALQDHVLDDQETWQLELLRRQLDVNEEEALLILGEAESAAERAVCPHCGAR